MMRQVLLGVLATLLVDCKQHRQQQRSTRPTKVEPAAALPGALAFDAELIGKIERAWSSRPPTYQPRTRQKHPDGSPKYTNRLFLQASPYLRQHAHNPVNWYPWGDEAFAAAMALGRPVLLSVGYSTCHWCHVMEEESFDDEEIAKYLNENYIAIKVDREEQPDIDAIYMNAVQMLTGNGGWPMTVWLTPDRQPFYGGTYFPARDGDRGSRAGFLTLLRRLRDEYDANPQRIAETASRLVRAVQGSLQPDTGSQALGPATLRSAFDFYKERFDETHGGIGRAPKFPSSLPVRFLLRYWRRTRNESALQMATLTLEKMASGGMYDHVGGGFHRYSTDAQWLVPHFEKMLYDNALLAMGYLEGYQTTGREEFARVGREILRYVERDMTSPDGAFYSAADADSPIPIADDEEAAACVERASGGGLCPPERGGVRGGASNSEPLPRSKEGWFFTWTPAEIEAALGRDQARAFVASYGVTQTGNFEGRNILHVTSLADTARFDAARETLYRERLKRPPPHRDEKVLVAWNGLMISALARAALVLGDSAYAQRAQRAADFVLEHMRKSDGRLLRSYVGDKAHVEAYLDDYAFLIAGLIDLYEATSEIRWLEQAIALDRLLERFYEDAQPGGYFMTSHDHEALLAREKPAYDGAEPSGNSVQALNLLRLHELTTDNNYRRRAARTLEAFSSALAAGPSSLSEMLLALDFQLDTPKEIVLVTRGSLTEAEPFVRELRRVFLPSRVLAVVSQGAHQDAHARLVPIVKDKTVRKDAATAYVCERRVCELPTSDPAVFAAQIQKIRKTKPHGDLENR